MSEFALFGISSMLICFTIATFILSRIPTNIITDEYDVKLDPLCPVLGVMFLGALGVYTFFPQHFDTIKEYGIIDFILPFIFAGIIYFCYLIGIEALTNIVIFILSLVISFIQPDSFLLFSGNLSFWLDRLVVALILFVISKGLGIMNGLGGIACLQFITVMIVSVILSHFGVAPQILACLALAYIGTILAFTFYSWPPEKLIMTNGGFTAIGFVLGCFVINMSVEYADASMFIACSYLFTEVGFVIYNRFLLNQKEEYAFMNTKYYSISNDGNYEDYVVKGTLKIFAVNVFLAVLQITANERLALPFFSVMLNLWLLSIISGETKPEDVMSITKIGFKSVKRIFGRDEKKQPVTKSKTKGKKKKGS